MRSTISGAIARRATTISRARMLRIGFWRRGLRDGVFGSASSKASFKVLADFACTSDICDPRPQVRQLTGHA
jgi:hypothetical protein